MRISTGVVRKGNLRQTFSVPRIPAITRGHSALTAILKEPAWNGSTGASVRFLVPSGQMAMRGFFSGTGIDVFNAASALSVETNLQLLDKPLKKVVVYLDPEEFKSTWLGNKAVYRTRMAIADDGDLIILAPGLKEFGEDKENDRLIRKYGYKGTPNTLKAVAENQELRDSLGAAAHLIHGSSEGRFRITYCPGPGVTAEEIRSVGFEYGDLTAMTAKYDPAKLKDGMNIVDGEEVFYISNPALGLWALKKSFC